jgi:hypothetical protein
MLAPCVALTQDSNPASPLISANRYGAIGDGKALDTVAIQAAIDAATRMGGTVVFSPGTFCAHNRASAQLSDCRKYRPSELARLRFRTARRAVRSLWSVTQIRRA